MFSGGIERASSMKRVKVNEFESEYELQDRKYWRVRASGGKIY